MRLLFLIYKAISYVFQKLQFDRILNSLIFSFNSVILPKDCLIRGLIWLDNKGTFQIGKRLVINSNLKANPIGGDGRMFIIVKKSGCLIIGNNVGISNSTIVCWSKITIEDNVNIGGGCRIYDTDFHSVYFEDRIMNGDICIKTLPVVIKNGAWLGAGVIVLKGVNIGERSVVAAGAVVTKNIPSGELWGGNPARFIRKLY